MICLMDATNNYNGLTDLANAKMGLQTAGFIVTTKKEFNEAWNITGGDSRGVFRYLKLGQNEYLRNLDDKLGYNPAQNIEDLKNIINYYKNNESTSIKVADKINIFKSIFGGKKYSALDTYSITKNYGSKILEENFETNIYIKDKDVITIVKIISDGVDIFLYKINNSVMKEVKDINKILKGATKYV